MPTGKMFGALAAVLALYLLLATASMVSLRPWCDEGWFSSPAWNLLTRGNMGTSVLDPTASWRSVNLAGINQYTYWIMPLYPVAEAAWYKATGFGLFSMRAFSVLWGFIALVTWFLFLQSLTGDFAAAFLAAWIAAIDFQFLWSASAGRMDMMAAALSFSAFAAYLAWRQSRLTLAVLMAHSLIAAAVFTHPVAAMAFVGLVFLSLYLDRHVLGRRHLLVALAPYLAGAAGWSFYILQNPAVFRAQFFGNASDRWNVFSVPLTALKMEVAGRYLETYGLGLSTEGASRLKLLILACYVLGVLGCLLTPGIRRQKGYRALLILTAIYMLLLPLIDGFQQTFYLVHILPMFAGLLAGWIVWSWRVRPLRRPLLAGILLCLAGVQCSVLAYRVWRNPYKSSYLKAGQFLKTRPGLVMASSEWAFQLGFDGPLVDDFRLGFRSGKRPDVIVIDEGRYGPWIENLAAQDPANYGYIRTMLAEDFRLASDQGYYKIYARSK
jgi:hypothetical protein